MEQSDILMESNANIKKNQRAQIQKDQQQQRSTSHKKLKVHLIALVILIGLIGLLIMIANQNQQLQIDAIEQINKKIQSDFLQNNIQQKTIKSRNTEICIIASQNSLASYALRSFQKLSEQTYKNWIGIYYLQSKYEMERLSSELKKESIQNQLKLKYHLSNGQSTKNIYHAITTVCPFHSYIFLLDAKERLMSNTTLSLIESYLQYGSFAAALPFVSVDSSNDEIKTQLFNPNKQIENFGRNNYFAGPRSEYNLLSNISNHLRIFNSDLYRLIPHRDLHYDMKEGAKDGKLNIRFYESSLAFQMTILESRCFEQGPKSQHQNMTKYLEPPFKVQFLRSPVFLMHKQFGKNQFSSQNTLKELKIIANKYRLMPLCPLLFDYPDKYYQWSKMLPSDRYSVLALEQSTKKSQTYEIPAKIHQIWIQGQPPKIKEYLSNITKQLHPYYEYRLWSKNDITEANFPMTYTILMKLFEIQKTSQYSKMAMIGDIMRMEILYHHGGFYIDMNYHLFQSFEKFRKGYEFVVPGFEASLHRFYYLNTLYGSIPKGKIITRMLEKERLAKIDLMSIKPNLQSGPNYIARAMEVSDEFSESIAIIPFEQIFPYYTWTDQTRFIKDQCMYKINDSIPMSILEKHFIEFSDQNIKLLNNCQQIYPYALGIDHFDLGGSWLRKKNGN